MPRQVRYEGKYLRYVTEDGWEFAERTKGNKVVLIIPVTPEGELVLVEQYRPAVRASVIEIPAGLVGDLQEDEETETAAARELEEETGYRAGWMELVAVAPLCPGPVDEIAYIYYAHDLEKTGTGGGVEDENIAVHHVPLEGVSSWLAARERAGALIDVKVYAALHFIGREKSGGAKINSRT